jgi:hypothetical protein
MNKLEEIGKGIERGGFPITDFDKESLYKDEL